MSSLEHHGIKGMKWGVRRYQNADGTLTDAGKRRNQAKRTRDEVQSIVDTLSAKERKLLGGTPGTAYMNDDELDDLAKRFVKKVGDTPVAFLDIYYASEGAGSVALATRSGKETRGKGYASELVREAQEWLDGPEAREVLQMSTLNWFARKENAPSIALAKKYGFSEREDYKDDPEWYGAKYKRR